jgi:glycosyltransferase involved in cell wall biosynthesis
MVIGIEATHANKRERSGVGEYCFEIIQSLKKTIPSSERVVLYSNKPLIEPLSELPPNWEVKILRWPFRKLWSQIRLSIHFLFRKQPDIFFAPGQLIPPICPKRTIVMIHDCAFLVYPKAYGLLSRLYLRRMNNRIIKKAFRIITSSEFNRKEIQRLYGVNPAKKVVVIPMSYQHLVPTPTFHPKDLGITKPYVLTIGRLETKKNTAHLIQSFSVLKQSTDVQLVLVGRPGRGYHAVAKELKLCPYSEDILRFDHLDEETLAGLLKHAAVFAFPSLYEGFGLPLLEALSLGVPTIASDIEPLHEVGGVAARFVDPMDTKVWAETMQLIVKDMGEQIKLSHEGRERAALFSWEKTAQLTWEAIAN